MQVAGRTFPPTGVRFPYDRSTAYRVVDGRIVEHAAIRDDLALLRPLEDAADDAPLKLPS